jgi:membrane associated rhomboid family serine protease
MLPLSDDNSSNQGLPVVNYALIAACVLVFLLPQGAGMSPDNRFTMAWSLVPEEIVTGRDVVTGGGQRTIVHQGRKMEVKVPGLAPTPVVYLTLLSSMFMHGSIMHLAGNMLFLWIFGDNLESRMGSLRYLIFYLLGGLAATMAHVGSVYMLGGDPQIPCLGASGAISAVMAGYALLFPDNRVQVLVFRVITEVPAIVAVGMWFLMQILSASLASEGAGGVAYGAHIGGFLAGLPLALLLCPTDAPGAGFSEG